MGANQFTAYTQEEFKAIFLGEMTSSSWIAAEVQDLQDIPNIDIDWTTKGKVSKVKNQGQCGSCWAFSAVASCESWALLESKQADLSEQQLVDCSGPYGNHGCNGGLKYIKDHGVESESAYPYKGVNEACKKQGGGFKINTISESSGCTGIINALEGRPVSVAVDAGGWSHYSSGVFNNCGKNIDHAVLLVGVINGVWKIKNSWGTSWGEKGFIRLASGDTCGICQ
jgi:C1A family cysteine protease